MLGWQAFTLLAVSAGCWAQRNYPGSTPCPDVAKYTWDEEAMQWQGLITIIPPVQLSKVKLMVKMTVNYYPLDAGYGRIDVDGGEAELHAITRRVLNNERQTLRYKIDFPRGKPTPRITSVNINEKEFCPNSLTDNDVRANINLEYNMNTGVDFPYASGDYFQVAGAQPRPPNHAAATVPPHYEYPTTRPTTRYTTRPNTRPTTRYTTRPTTRPTTRYTTPPTTRPWQQAPTQEPDQETYNQIDGEICGIPAPNLLIINGQNTAPGEWPWHVAMMLVTKKGTYFQCGGTLISTRHILTAAHCVASKNRQTTVPPDTLVIYLGRYNMDENNEEGQQIGRVQKIVVHPSYNVRNKLDFDIAVVVLSQDVHKTSTVMPACLWENGNEDLNKIVKKRGTVIGWGKDENGDMAQKLKSAKMPIVALDVCRASDRFYDLYASDNSFCAGFRNGTTVCNGDSGGGMHMNRPNPLQGNNLMWFVRGVVSKGKVKQFDDDDNNRGDMFECDDESYVIFTDVAKVMPWIRRTIGQDIRTPPQQDPSTQPPPPVRSQVACGRSEVAMPLILQGKETQPGQFPWHTALFISDPSGGESYQCGGSLVGADTVITAAHCVYQYATSPSWVRVYLGLHDLRQKNGVRVQIRELNKILLHPEYDEQTLENDIAMLKLQSPVKFNKYVLPICLWPIEMLSNIIDIKRKEGTVVGWGRTSSSAISNVLLTTKMPVVDNEKCRQSDYYFFGIYLRKSNFCAAYKDGSGVCNGDSGGGLYFAAGQPDGKSSWFLRGIVSMSAAKKKGLTDVCDPNKNVLFTNAAMYSKWISDNN